MSDTWIGIGDEIINPAHIAFMEVEEDTVYVHLAIAKDKGHEVRDFKVEAFIAACKEAGLANLFRASRR